MNKVIVVIYVLIAFVISFPTISFCQNITIGISSSTRARLELQGAVGSTTAIFGGESSGISLQRNWPGIGFNHYYNAGDKWIGSGFAAVQHFDPAAGRMDIRTFLNGIANSTMTGSNLALSISNNGNIGIRAYPVDASIYATKAGNFDGAAVFSGSHYASFFCYSNSEDTYIRPGIANGTVFINDIPGSKVVIGSGTSFVGINTTLPTCPLEIRQTGLTGLILVEPEESYNNWEQVVGFYEAGPHSSLKMLYNGQLKSFFRPTDGALVNTSDRRLKTNIRPLYSSLEKIMQLRPVEYEINTNKQQPYKTVGFIAQEVREVFQR
jgi:hypothetical protein